MRRLLTLTSALSLLICLAALSLWMPSYRRAETAYFNWRATHSTAIGCEIESGSGCVAFIISRLRGLHDDIPVDRWGTFETDETRVVPRNVWERFGFARMHQNIAVFGFTETIDGVGVPHWLIAAVCAVLPVQWLRCNFKRRRLRRKVAGKCVNCGYDLTGNASGACPECGMAVGNRPT